MNRRILYFVLGFLAVCQTGCKEPTPGDSDNGCGGSVIGSIMAVLTLTGAVVYLIKKRKEDE